jgi:hypothetical protein
VIRLAGQLGLCQRERNVLAFAVLVGPRGLTLLRLPVPDVMERLGSFATPVSIGAEH